MKKLKIYFIIKEWLILPYSIYEALSCYKPIKAYVLMEDVPEQNKIIPYWIIMWILEKRVKL